MSSKKHRVRRDVEAALIEHEQALREKFEEIATCWPNDDVDESDGLMGDDCPTPEIDDNDSCLHEFDWESANEIRREREAAVSGLQDGQ